jgi:exopolyphosphatase/guanosine-5'-triphosphate,3'-diphosphate pyrophosphatase
MRLMEIVRLGEGVDRTGRLAPEALERTLRSLRGYAEVIRDAGAVAVRMVATSATRDAENASEFSDRVKEVLEVAPEVLTGDEEARLSFTGATAELAGSGPASGSAQPPYLVADIGGGSTEFVLGAGGLGGALSPASFANSSSSSALRASDPASSLRPARAAGLGDPAGPAAVVAARSVNIGCVRMTERHLHSDPPSGAEIAAASADIDAALRAVAADVPVGQARALIGLAGSVTTVAGIALGLPAYDAKRIHHARISAAQVHAVTQRLLVQTRAERAAIGVMHPGRVDVIGAGALVLDRIMARFGFEEVLVSEHDILDGIAWSLAA